jgi:hypothetical protein
LNSVRATIPATLNCKLEMLENDAALVEFKKKLDDNGIGISALRPPWQCAASG